MKKNIFVFVMSLLIGQMAHYAQATTITISEDLDGDMISRGGAPWTASCSEPGDGPCMLGLEGATIASMSDTSATAYDKPGNPRSELSLLNSLLGLSGADAIESATSIAGSGNSFAADYQYFGIKQSTYIMFFENVSGAELDILFLNEFSHVTGFGEQLNSVSEVPVPAAAWLFGSALFGLSALGRRKRQR